MYRESPGKFDSRTLSRTALNRWTGPTLLDLCVSCLRRGRANLLCIVPILTYDPRRESESRNTYYDTMSYTIIYQHTLYLYISLSIYIYIYIERERETYTYMYVYIYIYMRGMSVYIYIYIERERDVSMTYSRRDARRRHGREDQRHGRRREAPSLVALRLPYLAVRQC